MVDRTGERVCFTECQCSGIRAIYQHVALAMGKQHDLHKEKCYFFDLICG